MFHQLIERVPVGQSNLGLRLEIGDIYDIFLWIGIGVDGLGTRTMGSRCTYKEGKGFTLTEEL